MKKVTDHFIWEDVVVNELEKKHDITIDAIFILKIVASFEFTIL